MRSKLEDIHPLGDRLLCTRYEKPEQVGGIWMNPAWLRDNNRQMWRLAAWGEEGAEILRGGGSEPFSGMLLITAPYQGTLEPAVDSQKEHFWIFASQVLIVLEENDGETDR